MHPIHIDRATGVLLRKIGHGRRLEFDEGSLTLQFCRAGGDGLILSAHVGDEKAQFWVDAHQWCQWIRPILVVPDWGSIPVDLRNTLAVWSCASVEAGLDHTGVAWCQIHSIDEGKCEFEPACSLRIERADAALDLRVIRAPETWLDNLADSLDRLPETSGDGGANFDIRSALTAGWSSVTLSTLERIQPGDAIVLQQAYAVSEGELALFTDRPLATVTQCRTGPYTIGLIMENADDYFAADTYRPEESCLASVRDSACVKIVAQVATIDIPIVQLANLKPGDILDGPAQTDGLVTLQVAGKQFARGTLLEIGGSLAVRIELLT